jgi:DNA-binding NarL/FixJ family response regulator
MNHPQPTEYGRDATLVQNGAPRAHSNTNAKTDDQGSQQAKSIVVVVDKRALRRECLARGLLEEDPSLSISELESLDEFHNTRLGTDASAILVILGSRKVSDHSVRTELVRFISEVRPIPVIVVADSDGPAEILTALESGAKGYIPTSVKVKVAAEAIGLARAGGIFVPANGVLALRDVIRASTTNEEPLMGFFTTREVGIVEALRKGKANKIIAYELQLCESTVKVHIRNIMKKLKATNRTEVAYKLREMSLSGD